jgi:predicted transcriptional regulator
VIDPNAIVPRHKNYRRGIINRSKIIFYLKKHYSGKTSEIAQKLNLTVSCVRYHTNILLETGVVKKIGREWSLSKNIQRTIDDFI